MPVNTSKPLGDSSSMCPAIYAKPEMHASSSDRLQRVTPIWSRDPFAIPEDHETMLEIDSKATRERTLPEFIKIFDDPQIFSGPPEPFPEYTPKPRPAPIYQDKQHEEYWTFLKSVPDIQPSVLPATSRCPSLVSGGTLSSRNSSTRSTRSSIWEPLEDRNSVRGSCILPACSGGCSKDLSSHARTHFTEQLTETCPVATCERHLKGFTRAGDRKRHAFTHFRGSLDCGFCESDTVSFSQASDRVGLFLTHLVKNHGARTQQLELDVDGGKNGRRSSRANDSGLVATCSVCSEPFTAQVLYEHLPGCILREVSRNAESDVREQRRTSKQDFVSPFDETNGSRNLVDSITEDEHINHRDDCKGEAEASMASVESVESENKEIAELTASSRCLSLTSSKAVESSEEETDWTEDVTSRESSPGLSQLPRRLSPTKRKVVETVMQEFQRLFNNSLRTHTAGGTSSSASSSNSSAGWSSNASTYSSASFVSRKRSLSGGDSTPPNDEDDSNKRRRPDSKIDAKQNLTELRFACPYYKRNPGQHPTFTSCRDPGFTTIARLKEHLYRRHLLPPQCHRCCTTFAHDTALRAHQRDERGCAVRTQMPLEGFDKEQERRLKSKKRSQTYQSEEEKWKGVYKILFPDDEAEQMPSPYIEYHPHTTDPNTPSSISTFQDFSRRELPRLVRRTLESVVEQEAQPLEDRLKERLVDIVRECQAQLVTMFDAGGTGPAAAAAQGVADVGGKKEGPTSTSVPASSTLLFDGFDSLPVRTARVKRGGGREGGEKGKYVNTHSASTSISTSTSASSCSLDSGYASTWLASSSTHDAAPTLDMTFPHELGTTDTVDLGGYYGLFESRGGMETVVGMNTDMGGEVGWSFLDSSNGVSNGMLGSLDELSTEWHMGHGIQ
ncbi:hypothetical protein BKA66DRAFT_460242 [Pyrenochaeta sp. MPI-SDFR-AT-0127]|nr:hypothetical protein BKA66DRAFT_460242 [Pyrenochaeta sp. MPI-SDFR-AT-0127]